MGIVAVGILAFFDVAVGFLYSRETIGSTPALGYVSIGVLVLLPAGLALTPTPVPALSEGNWLEAVSTPDGLSFSVAVRGLDYWLLWFMQFSVFGAGMATSQNLGLILESLGKPSAAGLGFALFALASSLSRMVAGVLSDRYRHAFSRFDWIVLTAVLAASSQFLMSCMLFETVMLGTLLAGLSFGSFFTLVVPVVGEMYGKKEYGMILGGQLASQAVASLGIL